MGTAKKVWSNIDFITVSLNACLPDRPALPRGQGFDYLEDLKPFGFYDRMTRLENGAILFESEKEQQGARLDMGGQCLQALRDGGWSDLSQLGWWYRADAVRQITRVDYAITLGGIGSPEAVLHEWDCGRVKTRMKKSYNANNRRAQDGHTAYFGGKKADYSVKVYDKGSELPELRELWELVTRVESKCKKPYAAAQVRDMLEFGIDDAGCTWLKSRLDFPDLRWWQHALSCTKIPLQPGRVKTDRFWDYAETFLSWVERRWENGEIDAVNDWFFKAYELQQKINGL